MRADFGIQKTESKKRTFEFEENLTYERQCLFAWYITIPMRLRLMADSVLRETGVELQYEMTDVSPEIWYYSDFCPLDFNQYLGPGKGSGSSSVILNRSPVLTLWRNLEFANRNLQPWVAMTPKLAFNQDKHHQVVVVVMGSYRYLDQRSGNGLQLVSRRIKNMTLFA